MDIPETQVHSFIIKLWLEKAGEEVSTTAWHGHITHVPSGDRHYLQDLSDIIGFIEPYLGETRADSKRGSRRPRSWLTSWTRRK
jgi:hypothetical protein